ncbi:GNAT family N-acetyltransferase [Fictibacillus aquaticus]|uniref:N-acetyltransferase domain-containing protein n=1 Tax=Fictibacillus aquaticus TaxID=2021314 RepID=A0A235FEC7_9BACL|nr:GNAT family N-acetyltransferase [Fictibacillus aquaticus]OYD59294.1 hypothetical protein CGZ90_05215 [Fictibacillus aquaticus]
MNQLTFDPFPALSTERLSLRKLDLHDADIIFNYQSNKENFKYVDMPVYTRLEEAKNYITRMNEGVSNNKWMIWAIAEKSTGEILGTISIWNISIEQKKAELGYGLYPGNIGKGIMSEALEIVTAYGFNEMNLKTLEAYTSSENYPSIALLERNQFSKASSIVEKASNGDSVKIYIYSRDSSD